MSDKLNSISVDKLYSAVEINPFLNMLSQFMADYNLNWYTFFLLTLFLIPTTLLLAIGVVGNNGVKKRNVWTSLVYLLTAGFVFCTSVLLAPMAFQEYSIRSNYAEYLKRVSVNVKKLSLGDNEKAVIKFCLKDTINVEGFQFYKNPLISGERLDKCVLRYGQHIRNNMLRNDFKLPENIKDYESSVIEAAKLIKELDGVNQSEKVNIQLPNDSMTNQSPVIQSELQTASAPSVSNKFDVNAASDVVATHIDVKQENSQLPDDVNEKVSKAEKISVQHQQQSIAPPTVQPISAQGKIGIVANTSNGSANVKVDNNSVAISAGNQDENAALKVDEKSMSLNVGGVAINLNSENGVDLKLNAK